MFGRVYILRVPIVTLQDRSHEAIYCNFNLLNIKKIATIFIARLPVLHTIAILAMMQGHLYIFLQFFFSLSCFCR